VALKAEQIRADGGRHVTRRAVAPKLILAMLFGFAACGAALGQQSGGSSSAAKKSVPATKPEATAKPSLGGTAEPTAEVAGSFGSWTLLCGKEGKDVSERCSLVLPLVEKESQKLMFRVVVTYAPRGELILRVDSPTGLALQRGVEFSPDTKKVYRMPFQTCLPMGCKALLLVSDDLRKELAASAKGSITVYALNGKAVHMLTTFTGFADAMTALDKHHTASQ
jgi:invasion protein IalB